MVRTGVRGGEQQEIEVRKGRDGEGEVGGEGKKEGEVLKADSLCFALSVNVAKQAVKVCNLCNPIL